MPLQFYSAVLLPPHVITTLVTICVYDFFFHTDEENPLIEYA